jgi:hypothetical protein
MLMKSEIRYPEQVIERSFSYRARVVQRCDFGQSGECDASL